MRAIAIFSPSRRSGKSWLITALARSLTRQGLRVVPFQSQTEITDGYRVDAAAEVSQSSAWQAWAAKIQPATHLNPVLLKACSPPGEPWPKFQLLIQGRGIGTVKRTAYYDNYYDIARPLIRECLMELQSNCDVLLFDSYRDSLCHPLASDTDQNFELLKGLEVPVAGIILIDCTHEGGINQLWGLWQRLSPENRQLIRGVIFNQWQGDRPQETQTSQWVKTHLKRPVLGYIRPLQNLTFDPESLCTLPAPNPTKLPQNKLRLQVLQLPNLSSYADFDPLMGESSVNLEFLDHTEPLCYPDAVIVPHTDQAIADLDYLHKYGYPQQLQQFVNAGGTVLGIGNGANLLSKKIVLPSGDFQPALGLMPFASQSHTKAALFPVETFSRLPFPNLPLSGMTLPCGILNYAPSSGYTQLFETPNLGLVNPSQNIWVVYLQGLFNNGSWCRFWLNALRQKRGLSSLPTGIANFNERQEAILETLANHIEQYIDPMTLLDEAP
ncbi:hypothetical protein AWQ21_08080 [Picosynechococcus sp. PCC 7003]|uniref:nucleotide-binding protein n=1 Tax=Picosynechococcus sp. PCC 7003 TaxID=374981 RepID=UPI000810E817|nr:AAA family ATPase [Picosynechococcus sp. PCC 7003]ANV84344.1 hypothetical protein AWQ21_08080 [Picosynechococcus sp. PCC 7003]